MPSRFFKRRKCIHALAALLAAPAVALAAPAQEQTQAPATAPGLILVVGDSLSAEYGLPRGSGWVALLEHKLAAEQRPWQVVNASVSGDTTSGGRARLPGLLKKHRPAIVIIELGGNDALRGLPLAATQDNLAAMTESARKAGARVLLAGMQAPPNYGADYTGRFAALYPRVAQESGAALVPFLLAGVADAAPGGDALALFQSDRIHPTAQAHPILLRNVWSELEKMLEK
ncbi:MAG: arylesterase [Ottowia sp.]